MKEFDDIFKNKLAHHSVDVPEHSWEKIAQKLPRKKFTISPVGYASILGLFISTVVVFGIYKSMTVNDKNQQQKIQAVNSDQLAHSQNEVLETNENSEYGWVNFGLEDLGHDENISSNQKVSSEIEPSILREKIKTTELKSQSNTNAALEFNFIATHLENDLNIHTNTTLEGEAPEISHNTDHIVDYTSTNEYNANKILTLITKNKLSDKEVEIVSLHEDKVIYEEPLKHFVTDREPCTFIWGGYQRSIDIYYSNDFVDMKIEGPESLSDHIDMRKATETSVYSFSMGARLGYNIGYRWNLHTGINYSQMTQRFQYTDPEANEPRTEIIKKYIYSNGNLVDSTFTEETVYLPGSKHHKVYNKYRTWDIPVLARYTLLANNKMSLSAMGGIFFNVSFQQTGIILDTDNTTPISLNRQSSEETRIFKAGLGVSAFASLSLAYYLTPSLDLLIEPNARIAPASMTTASYPLSQRFNSYGLSVGLRHRF